jgi:hypothetical protein
MIRFDDESVGARGYYGNLPGSTLLHRYCDRSMNWHDYRSTSSTLLQKLFREVDARQLYAGPRYASDDFLYYV